MNIKKTLVTAVLLLVLCCAPVAAANMVSYTIKDLGVQISLPAEYNYVFTRDMDEDDPILADWGLTKTELFKNDALYLEALTENQNNEVIVTMMETDWSELYDNFNKMTDDDLSELADYFLMNAKNGINMEYSDYSIFNGNSQAKFLKATGKYDNEDHQGDAIQYLTVVNGQAYTVTFDFYSGGITQQQQAMTEDAVASLHFDKITDGEQQGNKTLYIVIIAVMGAIILILLYVIRHKRYTINNTEAQETLTASKTSKTSETSETSETTQATSPSASTEPSAKDSLAKGGEDAAPSEESLDSETDAENTGSEKETKE